MGAIFLSRPLTIKEVYAIIWLTSREGKMNLNWRTLRVARHTFNNFFAQKYGRKKISLANWIFLVFFKSRSAIMVSYDFQFVKNTKAGPHLRGLAPEKAYPEEERNRGEEDIKSLFNFLRMSEAGKTLPRIIIGEVDGEQVMLDGDHRAIAASIRGVWLPARIVRIP